MKFILFGKSGVGKSTQEKLVSDILGIPKIISTTTRKIRRDEIDGVDYHFVTKEAFFKLQAEESFVQISMFKGNHYGIQHSSISDNCVAVLEPIGIMQLQEIYDDIVPIKLILPETLRQERLANRNTGQSMEDEERFDNFPAKYSIRADGTPEEVASQIVYICRDCH